MRIVASADDLMYRSVRSRFFDTISVRFRASTFRRLRRTLDNEVDGICSSSFRDVDPKLSETTINISAMHEPVEGGLTDRVSD